MSRSLELYTSGAYWRQNPTWDEEDSPWKANHVASVLRAAGIEPQTICDVGCGAGGVLLALRAHFPNAALHGYDVAPDAARFWTGLEQVGIQCVVGDGTAMPPERFDVALILDVIEHVPDPFAFLRQLQGRARYYLFHVPLDLSAGTVLRERPILEVRRKVGHVHYFTKNLALALLDECGYEVTHWRYSGAAFGAPRRTWKTRVAAVARRIAYAVNKDWGVRALGGETLLVLCREAGAPHPGR